MSYQVLARKWRPTRFDEVAGQAHVTTALRNAILTERIPHAVLLTGPRGVGKTTIARLFARALNCEKGPTPEPCGACSFCRDILSGASTDVQEIDAASRTSVDDVREIIEAVRYAPTPGKWRIYVVDEVHMLSAAAFNALLKTLEEPPPRSLFVFATTNPEKIPFTVVSRCQRHDLRRLSTAEVTARLREVARAEGLRLADASLLAIARAGEGSLRDALTLLDQVIAVGGAEASETEVAQILDLIDPQLLLAIARACVERDAAGALAACARAGQAGIDAKRLGAALVKLLRDLVVLRIAPDRPGLVDASDAELAELRALAARGEPARLRRMFHALVREQEDLAWAPEPLAVLEMAVVRLATLAPGDELGALLSRLEALERRLAAGGGAGGSGAGGGAAGRDGPPEGAGRGGARERGAPASSKRRADAGEDPSRAAGAADAPAPGDARDDRAGGRGEGDAPRAAEAGAPDPSPPSEPGAELPPLEALFDRLAAFAKRENRGLFAGLEGGRAIAFDGERLRISLPGGIAARRVAARRHDLEAACARFFGRSVRVELELAEAPGAPAAAREAEHEAAERRRKAALDHAAVNTALEILDGEILEIRPLGGPAS